MPKSISDRIALLFLVSTLIPVVLFGVFLASERYHYLEKELLNKRQTEARQLGNLISDYFDTLTVEIEFVSSLFARQGMEDSEKFILLKTLQTLHPVFFELGTLDRDGRKFIARQGADSPSPPLSDDDEILNQILSRRQIIASFAAETEKKIPQLKIACPIFFLNKQFINGAILATVDLSELNRQIIRYTSAAGIEGSLLLAGGRKISGTPLTLLDDATVAKVKDRFPLGGSEIVDNSALAFIPIQYHNLQFALLIGSDLSQLLGPWYQSLLNYFILFLLILAAIVLTGHFFVKRIFATPLETLTKAAEKIRDGKLGQHVELGGKNEFSELADTFNAMTSALVGSHAKLQEESRQREEAEASSREAMVEAQQANEEKSIFLANMSHEIRTPINGILGLSTLLLNSTVTKEQQYRLELIGQSSRRLFSMLDMILNFSKIEAGESTLELIRFEPRQLVRDALKLIQVDVGAKDIILSSQVADNIPQTLTGDGDKINQVLLNLLSNGIKNTECGEVSLTLTASAKSDTDIVLCFCVADTGSGVSEEISKTIFHPFTQGENGLNNKSKGVGLGLAICTKLATLMGGKVWFENNENKGSSFYFSCRCEKPVEDEAVAVKSMDDPIKDKLLTGLLIAIAEDEFINRYMLSSFLEEHGAEVLSCENGRELLTELESKDPDVILMDIQMPVMDGLEATAIIRKQEEAEGLAPVPIIALTAHATGDFMAKCFSTGMDLCLTKPLDLPAFPDILQAELDLHSTRQPKRPTKKRLNRGK